MLTILYRFLCLFFGPDVSLLSAVSYLSFINSILSLKNKNINIRKIRVVTTFCVIYHHVRITIQYGSQRNKLLFQNISKKKIKVLCVTRDHNRLRLEFDYLTLIFDFFGKYTLVSMRIVRKFFADVLRTRCTFVSSVLRILSSVLRIFIVYQRIIQICQRQ